eukprot:COSAG02_NODE_279_length_25809_cov_21.674173_9_plen_65_part_00
MKLKEAKAGDMVTVEKLASIDEKKVSEFLDDACITCNTKFVCDHRVSTVPGGCCSRVSLRSAIS